MSKFDNISDHEINVMVARAINQFHSEYEETCYGINKRECSGNNVVNVVGVVDYCNIPNDAYPIIIANGINLVSMIGNKWRASSEPTHFSIDENPLRAAMICFLDLQLGE